MSKQSSIEWLIDQVEDFIGLIPVDIIEQAKQMHKEEIEDAKWMQERMYSEEEVFNLLCKMPNYFKMTIAQQTEATKEWFEQFNKGGRQ